MWQLFYELERVRKTSIFFTINQGRHADCRGHGSVKTTKSFAVPLVMIICHDRGRTGLRNREASTFTRVSCGARFMSDRIPLRHPGFCLRTTPTMVVVLGSSWRCCCTSATDLPAWQCLVSYLGLSVRSKNSRVDCSENIAPRCVRNSGLSSYDSFKVDREHVDCQEDHQAPVVLQGPLRRTARTIEDNRFLSVSRPLLCLPVSIQACAILHAFHGSWCGPNGHSGDSPSIRTVVSIEKASLHFLSLVSSAIVSWVSSILPGSVKRGRVGGGTGVVVFESKTRHTMRRRVQGSGNAHPRRDTTSNSNVQLPQGFGSA